MALDGTLTQPTALDGTLIQPTALGANISARGDRWMDLIDCIGVFLVSAIPLKPLNGVDETWKGNSSIDLFFSSFCLMFAASRRYYSIKCYFLGLFVNLARFTHKLRTSEYMQSLNELGRVYMLINSETIALYL